MVTDGELEAEVFLFFHSIHGFWNVETTNSTGISSISLSKVVDGQVDTSTSKEGSGEWRAWSMDVVKHEGLCVTCMRSAPCLLTTRISPYCSC